MALSRPHARPALQARVPKRMLLIGLAAAVGLGGTYVAIEGNPLARSGQTVVYDSTPVRQGTLQVTVSATGPITPPTASTSATARFDDPGLRTAGARPTSSSAATSANPCAMCRTLVGSQSSAINLSVEFMGYAMPDGLTTDWSVRHLPPGTFVRQDTSEVLRCP